MSHFLGLGDRAISNTLPLWRSLKSVNELISIEMQLAQVLYETMDQLDPEREEPPKWEELRDRDREFYRLLVDALIEDGELVQRALPLTCDSKVSGGSENTE